MARINLPRSQPKTHEGGKAQAVSPLLELKRTVMTCLLWENTFYESGSGIAKRIERLVEQIPLGSVAEVARMARDEMHLRHVPLFLLKCAVRKNSAQKLNHGTLLANTLADVIRRPDELSEFVSLYWKDGRQPLAACAKRGLAKAFQKFDAYQLAKWDRPDGVKLRDVLFLCHAEPKDLEQEKLWKKLVERTLEPADTWEAALSRGDNKQEAWERLLRERKLGGMAVLANLRNMVQANVDRSLIRQRLEQGAKLALPFRFIAAARHVPEFEDSLEAGMLKSLESQEKLPGTTVLVVDVSGSMQGYLHGKTSITRIDAACGVAILLREICEQVSIFTFSEKSKAVPPRRGFALRDAVTHSQGNWGTYLARSLGEIKRKLSGDERVIVITDEQSHDGVIPAWNGQSYMINVAPYKHGVSYTNGWHHIDGWSEKVVDYIRMFENFNMEEDEGEVASPQ